MEMVDVRETSLEERWLVSTMSVWGVKHDERIEQTTTTKEEDDDNKTKGQRQ